MLGWKSGAGQLARIAIALVIGSAILARLAELLQSFFSRSGLTTVAGGFVVVLLLLLVVLAIGWFVKQRSESGPPTRPTIRRRAPLADLAENPSQPLPAQPPSTSTDDLQLFGGGQ